MRIWKRLLALMLLLCFVQGAQAESAFGFSPVRTYEGARYEARPPAETTTVLLIGYDHHQEGMQTELHGYSSGGQADFLLLVVLDHRTDEIRMLQIDRDTMARVRVTDARGYEHDRGSLQICLSHAYGNTREKNNANTVLAVETLLGIESADDGAQIDWYVAMDISGIARLNDLLGGVTLTMQTDMTDIDPAMTAGATLTLTGRQAERFCRGRYGVGDQTNESRMLRQQQYIAAASQKLVRLLRQDISEGVRLLDGMGLLHDATVRVTGPFDFSDPVAGTPAGDAQGHYLMTNAMRATIISDLSRAAIYKLGEIETLPGVHSLGSDGYIRFDMQQDAALRWALDVFYDNID